MTLWSRGSPMTQNRKWRNNSQIQNIFLLLCYMILNLYSVKKRIFFYPKELVLGLTGLKQFYNKTLNWPSIEMDI